MALEPVQSSAQKQRRSISLRMLMICGFGGLVLLSIGGVLYMSVAANFTNTFSLLNTRTLQLIAGMERSIASETNQVEFALRGLERLHNDGTIDLENEADRKKILPTTLRSTQVIEALSITFKDGTIAGFLRAPNGQIRSLNTETASGVDVEKWPKTTEAGNKPIWTGSVLRDNVMFHEAVQTLHRDGQPIAQIKASVGGRSINRLVASFANDEITTAFVLNDQGKIIAHSEITSLFKETPTVAVGDFPTIAMKQFSGAKQLRGFVEGEADKDTFQVSRSRNEFGNYFYITKLKPIFSNVPYTLGAYFKASDMTAELRRAGTTATVGLIALFLTLLAAVILTSYLSKPMRRISDATRRFSRLELDGFEPLPRSRVQELDTQSAGINSMHTALNQFSRYVPQKLVARILESGSEVTRPVERPVTVMFTDIANFTAGSENLDAAEITTMLNEHFELISRQIARCHGTVDKYLGDGVMAFWGAPETDDNHAAHAIQAATAIKHAFELQCDNYREEKRPPMQLRIGIHSGRAIVGNVGGDDRTNYTVIGHTVNVANRIEQLGKELINSSDVVISISSDCFEAAGQPDGFASAGAHVIRGSSKPLSLYVYQPGHDENVVSFDSTGS